MELEVKCPYCGYVNTIDTDSYGIDPTQVSSSGNFEGLYARCYECTESFMFDVEVDIKAVAFDIL